MGGYIWVLNTTPDKRKKKGKKYKERMKEKATQSHAVNRRRENYLHM